MEENTSGHSPDAQVVLNQLILDYLKNEQRKRRWRWVMRGVVLAAIVYVLLSVNQLGSSKDKLADKPHAALIDVKGPIFDGVDASADNLARSMKKAYADKGTQALILRINSPGGSPVQASYMFNTIEYYRKLHPKIKIYAVCMDACASAAYYVASASDEIYANPSSLVGSIGVLYNGFGFVDGMQKLGIERRLITAGSNKGFLDPFSPLNPEQATRLKSMLGIIHKQFEDSVIRGRGARLTVEGDTFSGLFWTGEQAKAMGLIDGFGSSGDVLRQHIKLDVSIDYTIKPNYLEKFAKNLGLAMSEQAIHVLGLTPGIRAQA